MSIIQGNVKGGLVSGGYTIDQSLRFNDDDSAFMSRTPSVAGNRKTWTFSTWVKRGNLSTGQTVFSANTTASARTYCYINSSNELEFYTVASTYYGFRTTQLFRDSSAWYHLHFVYNSSNATASERMKLYVNGVLVSTFAATNYPTQNLDSYFNNNNIHSIGRMDYGGNEFLDGYLAETHFIDGQALTPDNFGEFDETYGHWKPIAYDGTYGTNGFYLDNSGLGTDVSGNGNNFTATNLTTTDIVLDSPTNNFATLNPLQHINYTGVPSPILSEGCLSILANTTSGDAGYQSSISIPRTGKWYFEHMLNYSVTRYSTHMIALAKADQNSWTYTNNIVSGINIIGTSISTDTLFANSSVAGTTGTHSVSGDIIALAYDADNQTLQVYKNGVAYGSQITGINDNEYAFLILTHRDGDGTRTSGICNFGQDSSFAGNKTAQGNTDDNGIGDFYYAPPAGYLALCTANLPEPTVVPSKNFNVVLDTGANIKTTSEALFPSYLEWVKDRANANNHQLIDTVRGTSAVLQSNTTSVETTYTTPSGSSVGWVWKAGGTPVTNTDGSITSQVSANVDAGFSIVIYTGDGAGGGNSVGHGLSQSPELWITKNRDSTTSWWTGTTVIDGSIDNLYLNLTNAKTDSSTSAPTSSVINLVDGNSFHDASGNDYICYAFHSVEGYSKIGSYIGNGSTDGTFVYCGFRPRYILTKRTNSTSNWILFDTERDSYNVMDSYLLAESAGAEASPFTLYDSLSNGFKCRTVNTTWNTSGSPYLFMAFAETPFKYTNAR